MKIRGETAAWGVILVIVAVIVILTMSGCSAMRAGVDRVTEPLMENSTRAGLSLGVGAALFLLVPAAEFVRLGLALLGTYITQSATTDKVIVVQGGGMESTPWYLDPMQYVWGVAQWLVVAILLGLCFTRSRQHTVQFVKDMASLRPIAGAKRFAAGMGWIHSDKAVPEKAKDKR